MQEHTSPSSKRPRPAEDLDARFQYNAQSAMPGPVPHIVALPWRLQDLQNMSSGPVHAAPHRVGPQSVEEKANADNGMSPGVSTSTTDWLSQQDHSASQVVTDAVFMCPTSSTLAVPDTNDTNIRRDRHSINSSLAVFQSGLRYEVEYQHRILRSLHPHFSGIAPKDQVALVREIWMRRYRSWEQVVRMRMGLDSDHPTEDKAKVFALMMEIYKKELPKKMQADNTARSEAELDSAGARANILTGTLHRYFRAIKNFRNELARKLAIEQNQSISALGSATASSTESGVAIGGSVGSSHSNATFARLGS